jgi:hypothetical protein
VSRGFFVLHELRLTTGDDSARLRAAARLADMPQAADEQVLPMLVSIDDHRDVACVRRVRVLPEVGDDAGVRIQTALAPEPAGSEPPRYYRERAAVSGEHGVRSYYRMAVTESGTNGQSRTTPDRPAPRSVPPLPQPPDDAVAEMLWIGAPVASGTGLLVITGHRNATAYVDGDPRDWPLSTSRDLGVRIYESART